MEINRLWENIYYLIARSAFSDAAILSPASVCQGVRLLLIFMAITAGCAGNGFVDLRPPVAQQQQIQGHYIPGVPFFRQEENSCGPAALAAVISYWGRKVNMEQIVANVYLPELRGTLPMDMEQFMREAGLETTSFAGTLDNLKYQVLGNVPVISLLDTGFGPYRRPHYVTIIGFDDTKGVITAHDGWTADKKITYKKFLKEWDRAGNWMLVAVPGTRSHEDKQ